MSSGRHETDFRLDPELVSPSADQLTVAGENDAADSGSATIRHQNLVRMGLVGGTLVAAGLLTAVEVKAQDTDQDDDDRGRGILQDDDGDQDPTRTPNPTVRATRTPFITWGQAGTATATPTPDASPTVMASPTLDASPTAGRTVIAQVPTETPTPGETLVAAADLGPMGEFRSSLADYPGTVRYTDAFGRDVRVETDMTRVEPLMGVDGRPILPGIYLDGNRPAGIDPQIGMETIFVNGNEVVQAYLVGTIHIEQAYGGPMYTVSVPMRIMDANYNVIQQAPRPYFGQFQFIFNYGAVMYAIDTDGRMVNPISLPSSPLIPVSTDYDPLDPNTAIVFNPETGVGTFPTAEGLVEIRNGDQVLVSYVFNAPDALPGWYADTRQTRTPEEILNQLMLQPQPDMRIDGPGTNFNYPNFLLTPQNQ